MPDVQVTPRSAKRRSAFISRWRLRFLEALVHDVHSLADADRLARAAVEQLIGEAVGSASPTLAVGDADHSRVRAVCDTHRPAFVDDIGEWLDAPRSLPAALHERWLDEQPARDPQGRTVLRAARKSRRATSSFYTPAPVVDHLLALTLGRQLATRQLRVTSRGGAIDPPLRMLDPACGCGAFLIPAAALIGDWCRTQLTEQGVDRDAASLLPQLAAQCLFGIDTDADALRMTAWALALACGGDADTFAGNVVHGDALLDPTLEGCPAPRDGQAVPLDWRSAFCDAADGFDIVIGNPPYQSHSGRHAMPVDAATRAYLRRHFTTAGWPTLHGLFIERAVRDLSRGMTAMVVPDQVAHLEGYAPARQVIAQHASLVEARFWGEDVFPQAVTPALTFVADIAHNGLATIVDRVGRLSSITARAGDAWRIVARDHDALLRRLFARTRSLGDTVADIGVHTGNCAKQLVAADAAAIGEWVPVLEGKQVSRYRCSEPTRYLRLDFTPDSDQYFSIRERSRYERAAYVIRQTAAYPIAAPRRGAVYFRNSLLALYPPNDGIDIRLIAAVLNSRLMRFVYQTMVVEAKQKAFPQVKIRSLRALPMFDIDLSQPRERDLHDRLVAHVCAIESILAADQPDRAAADHMDADIDAHVCDLYGLSAKQVAVIERATQA